MIASIVNGSQSHLSTPSTALRSGTINFQNTERSRTGSESTRVGHVNNGWGKTEQMKAPANAMARQIRAMDTQVQNLAHAIRRMSTDIRAFRKNFPPFPRGSEERERLLNSFQGIRKQIERLTIPPKSKAVPNDQGQDVSQMRSLGTLMERYETLLQTIRERLPAIPADTTDVAMQKLEQELETLLAFIYEQHGERVEFIKYYQGGDDTETAVQMASFSITLGQTFSEQSHWQMTVSQTQLKVLQV